MKKLLFVAVVLMASTSLFAAAIQVDFDHSSNVVTQSGWLSYTGQTSFDMGGGVVMHSQGGGSYANPQSRDRESAGIMAGLGLDDLLRDFHYYNGSFETDPEAIYVRTITGLPDGDYNVTLYRFDAQGAAGTGTAEVNGGATWTFGPAVAGDIASISHTFQVTLSGGAGVITLSDTTAHSLRLNGIVIDAVPEPATMLLVGTGLLGFTGFIRRRMMK